MNSQYTQAAQPIPIAVPIGSGRSIHTESRFGQLQATQPTFTYPVFSPSTGTAHHESSFHQSRLNQAASPQIIYTAAPSGGAHSSHFSERYQSQTAAAPQIVAPIYPSGGSSRYTAHSENFSNQGLSGGVVPIAAYPSGSTSLSSRLSEESSASNSNFGSGVTGFTYPSGSFDSSAHHQQLNARFGEYAPSSGLCK